MRDKRLVHRQVEQLLDRHLLVFAQIFAHAVVDDDGVVDRIADDGQDGRDTGQVELEPGDDVEADHHGHVVDRRDDGADAELPFEAEPDVDQHGDQRGEDADRAVAGQFARTPSDRPTSTRRNS